MAIDAARLRHWLALFAQAGLAVAQALPDAWLLPVSEGGTTLVSLQESYWLRFSPGSAGEADTVLLPLLLSKCPAGEVCCYGDVPQEVQVDERLAWQHPLVLIQPQWQGCRINMLHGEFSGRSASGPRFRHAKTALAAAALLCVGLLIGPALVWRGCSLISKTRSPGDDHRSAALFPDPAPDKQPEVLRRAKYQQGEERDLPAARSLNQIRQSLPSLEITAWKYDETQNQLTLNVKSMINKPCRILSPAAPKPLNLRCSRFPARRLIPPLLPEL